MKAVKVPFLFLFIFNVLLLCAQQPTIKWGEMEKGKASYGNVESIGWAKKNYFTMQGRMNNMGKYKYYLEKLNPQLGLEYTTKLESKTYSYSYAKIIDEKIYMFQMKNNGLRMNEAILFYNLYDLNGNLLDSKDILSIEDLSNFNQTTDIITYDVSPDEQKLGVSFLNTNKKESYTKLINIVVDVNNFDNPKLHMDFIPLDKKFEIKISDIAISNNGSIVTSYGIREDYEAPYHYALMVMSEKGEFMDPIDLKVEEYYLSNIQFTPYTDYFMLTGYFVIEKEKENVVTGFFLAKLDAKENKINNLSSFSYTEEFFTSLGYTINKDGNVNFGGSYDLNIVPDNKGGGFLIADHVAGSRADYHLQSLESIIIPFNSNGDLAEKTILPKKVYGNGAHVNGSGYFAFVKDHQLCMVYNEHLDNLKESDYKEFEMMDNVDDKKSGTVLATIENGKAVKRELLFSFKDQKGYLVPEKCSSKNNKILLGIGDSKKVQYGLLNYK